MNTIISLGTLALIVFGVEWVAMLILGRSLRRQAAQMAKAMTEEITMLTALVPIVEDMQRMAPEKEEMLDLTRVLLLGHRDQLQTMRAVLEMESSKKPPLLQHAGYIRAIVSTLKSGMRQRKTRRRLNELDGDDT